MHQNTTFLQPGLSDDKKTIFAQVSDGNEKKKKIAKNNSSLKRRVSF